MEKKYTYDAFISYRHTEPDKFVAENLHKQMEAFRLPGKISRKKSGRTRIERVFRDKDELPLTSNLEDPIMEALRESEYLIVICSPRLKESLWCKKEVETFISLHGREHVLAVLVEGEPEESFPEELLYAEETIQKPDGTAETIRKPMEPLAADVRGKNRHAMLKAMRTEILRLLAPMFSLNYDDLRQRHRERRMKRILTASLAGAAVCFAFGAVSTAMALRIQSQKQQIEIQSTEIREQNEMLLRIQAENLAEESLRELEEGDRIGAIRTAVSALTEYEGMEMPYTARAQRALTESLHVYDCGSHIKAQYQLETAGVIDFMKMAPDRETLVTYDESKVLTVWDIGTGTILKEIRDINGFLYSENECTYLGADRFAYITEEHKTAIYTISKNEIRAEDIPADSIFGDTDGKYLLVKEGNLLRLFDAVSLEELAIYEAQSGNQLGYEVLFDRQGKYFVFEETLPDEEDGFSFSGNREIRFFSLSDNTVCGPIPIGRNYMQDMRMVGDTAYVLFNSSEDYMHTQAEILVCSPQNGEISWRQTYEDCFGDSLLNPYAEGADKLLFATSSDARLIDMDDGTECARFALGSSTAGAGAYVNADRFLVFTRTGENHIIDVDTLQDYYFIGMFQCHSQNVKEFLIAAEEYLVLPYMDNRITVYNYSTGPGLEEANALSERKEAEYLDYSDAVSRAKELGLAKADLTKYLFYNEDESLMGVSYSDATLEIYRVSDMSRQFAMTDAGSYVRQFMGTDRNGNLFIGGYADGYMLNPDFELLGVIEGLVAVDAGANRLIIEDEAGIQYAVPIYTVEELLAIADEYVLR